MQISNHPSQNASDTRESGGDPPRPICNLPLFNVGGVGASIFFFGPPSLVHARLHPNIEDGPSAHVTSLGCLKHFDWACPRCNTFLSSLWGACPAAKESARATLLQRGDASRVSSTEPTRATLLQRGDTSRGSSTESTRATLLQRGDASRGSSTKTVRAFSLQQLQRSCSGLLSRLSLGPPWPFHRQEGAFLASGASRGVPHVG